MSKVISIITRSIIFTCMFFTSTVALSKTVDWLVFYDSHSNSYFNGDPTTAMQSWTSQINDFYRKSNVDIQLRLVGVLPNENNAGDQTDVLHSVRQDSRLIQLREERGADFVMQLHKTGNCGVGYVAVQAAWAWNVSGPHCGAYTAAHELGHNMGLSHSRRQGNTGGARYKYGLGYGVDNRFATIMAYTSAFSASRAGVFSDPNRNCSGLPCGIPVGQPQQAYAVLALNNVKQEVSNFKPTRYTGNSHVVKVDTNRTRYDYDFGSATSPVQSGWTRISPETNGDIRWSALVHARDRGAVNGANTINRDIVFSNSYRTLSHKIKNGRWSVTLNLGDATHAHDRMQVFAEGSLKKSNISNAVADFPYVQFIVDVSDSELNISFADEGGNDPNWVVTRLTLKREGESVSSSTVRFVKRNATSFAIDGGAGASNNQNVKIWASDSNNVNQQWVEIAHGGNYFSYQKQNTNYCIDGGSGGQNGQNVVLQTCNSNNHNQHWQKVNQAGGSFRLAKRNASNYSLDGGNGGSNGKNLYLWSSNDGNQNQHWLMQ